MTDVIMLATPEPPRRRIRARWIILAIVGAIVLIGGGLFLDVWIRAGKVIDAERRYVADRTATLRGERVTRPNYFEPAEEGNSWDLFASALTKIGALTDDDKRAFASLREEGDEVPSESDVARVLAIVDPEFEVLKKALRRTWVEPGYRYEDTFSMLMPLVAPSIVAIKILDDRAQAKHEEGKADEAADLLIIGWGLSHHLAVKGALINELVRYVCSQRMADQLRKILADHQLTPDALARLEAALAKLDGARPKLIDVMRREELWGRSGILEILEGGKAAAAAPGLTGSPRHLFTLRIMAAEYFSIQNRFMDGLEKANHLPFRDCLKRLDDLMAEALASKNPLVALLSPQLSRVLRQSAQQDLRISLSRLAIAIARHREERGAFPVELADLVPTYLPAIPADEYSGSPFRYLARDDAATVYSIGGDGDDDGGKPIPEDEFEEDGDVAWIVKRRSPVAK